MWEFVALDNSGIVLWNYNASDGEESGAVDLSTNGSNVWASSACSGWNGSIYFVNLQGDLLWRRQIYSPTLSIQTGNNLTGFISTNWGALLYASDGSLLENLTTSSGTFNGTSSSSCKPLPNFWYRSDNEAQVIFLDALGNMVSSYDPGGYINIALLSSDGHFALISSYNGAIDSLTLVFLPNGISQNCPRQ